MIEVMSPFIVSVARSTPLFLWVAVNVLGKYHDTYSIYAAFLMINPAHCELPRKRPKNDFALHDFVKPL
jgi:hypothetical protein